MSDDDIIRGAVQKWHRAQRITAGEARVIAAGWIAPNCRGLTAFCTSGAVVDSLTDEVNLELRYAREHDTSHVFELCALRAYVQDLPLRGPVHGWAELWGDARIVDTVTPAGGVL